MGIDFEVDKRADSVKDRFLSQERIPESPENCSVSLESAFEATRHNRNSKLVIAVSVLLLILVCVSASFHYYMRALENSVEINITEFDDVRLKEALFSMGNTTMELGLLKSELAGIESHYKIKLAEINHEFDRQEQLAKIQGNETEIERIVNERESAIKMHRLELEQVRDIKLQAIASLEDKTSQAEQKMGNNRADILNPEQKLQSLRVAKVQEYYESRIATLQQEFQQKTAALILKYNPEVADADINRMLNRSIEPAPTLTFNNAELASLLGMGAISNEELEKLQQFERDQLQIIDGLRQIPFINMPQSATEQLYKLNHQIMGHYVNLTVNLMNAMKKKSGRLGNYEFMMSNMVARLKTDGLIIDPSDQKNIIAFFRTDYIPKKNDRFSVFRYETELDVKLNLQRESGQIVITMGTNPSQLELMPFDKLILEN